MSRAGILTGLIAAAVATAAIPTPAVAVGTATMNGLVLSVETEKEVYTASEAVYVELYATNATDKDYGLKLGPGYYRQLIVLDASATSYQEVYSAEFVFPNDALRQVVLAHERGAIAMMKIPANKLKPGKRYVVMVNLSVDLGTGGTVFSNASTIIRTSG